MAQITESQPFLYSDDPTVTESKDTLGQPFRRAGRRHIILTSFGVAVGTSLLWVIVLLLCRTKPTPTDSPSSNHTAPSRYNITTGAHLLSCGKTAREARSQGCRYDILLNNWVPAPCYDQEWIDEYTEDLSWGAYADISMTVKLSVEEMSERDFYYTSIRDHINHCAIMWKKQFWVLYEKRNAFDTVIANPGHTEHCAQYLMDVGDANYTEPTKTHMGFAGCWVRE
ncbi:hypothetical protein BKA67DRAFT_274181 [Truncatella angustata]|uniref:Uncharacterized protein n=1 Tax=Truncatella angustata TaxID=152316 RepID=A0A9P8ULF6_9PEZI|nr:uncharacterized protein BKA67DRAFT_274181 [Truncatella angustata]KAH6654279.1 hypothetical protein BKA67DRAFT_274181 [Truncatella angustata]KAH8203421.1 hypothetical protein TruAng_002405 [Truncatella angustata]